MKVLVCATNYGTWGEELQAPWDALKNAGFDVTLATPQGKKPLPLAVSVDPDFVDPIINFKVNPKDVCDRIKQLVNGTEWNNPIKFKDAKMDDYDAIVLTGGLGAMFDMCNNYNLHKLIIDAYRSNKLIGALCYAVAALVYSRDPKNDYKSVIYGKKITAHPRAWDFYGPNWDFTYDLYGATSDNKGTDVHTPGFLWPLEDLVRDAVGPNGACISRVNATRKDPEVNFDWPFVTGTSVESSIAYGDKIVEVLKKLESEKSSKKEVNEFKTDNSGKKVPQGTKIAILLENRFIDKEILYYTSRFAEEGINVRFMTRLWGQSELTFKGMELGLEVKVNKSFEDIDDGELGTYAAVIVPAGYVSDYLLYTDNPEDKSPAVKFIERAMNNKNIIKGFICHSLWLGAPAADKFRNRKVTCHNNIVAHVKNMGADYKNEDIVIDNDLVTGRTGGHFAVFAKTIIEKLKK